MSDLSQYTGSAESLHILLFWMKLQIDWIGCLSSLYSTAFDVINITLISKVSDEKNMLQLDETSNLAAQSQGIGFYLNASSLDLPKHLHILPHCSRRRVAVMWCVQMSSVSLNCAFCTCMGFKTSYHWRSTRTAKQVTISLPLLPHRGIDTCSAHERCRGLF